MSLIVGSLLACLAGLAGTLLCSDDKTKRSRLPLLAGILASGLVGHNPAKAGEVLHGRAEVIDGGTLRIGERRVSLIGIVAPDVDQSCSDAHEQPYSCGHEAARALADHIGEAAIVCEPHGMVGSTAAALCRFGDEDLGAWMVGRGYAVPDETCVPDYMKAAERAWGRRLGLWSGVFQDLTERRTRQDAVVPRRIVARARQD